MKISILGGGNEIGASCLYVQVDGTHLLIDAGMRVHGDDLLPAIGMLADFDPPEAILVTHAHADHIGALPVIHTLYPNAPVYATPPTADLMEIMMRDSFKIMEQRCRSANALPAYTKEQMQALLEAVRLFPASGVLQIGNVKVTCYRAGHILGAVMFAIEGGGEKLFVTGDLSFRAGRTIPGAEVPHDLRPDVLIMESTYGNRAHADRHTEEKRLADNVAEVIAGGGFALIPAFALGRAQEVLLILQDYMDRGLIPEFPIYVDGLVTPISKIYRRYPQYLKGPVAHRIRQNGDAFLTEGRCKAVQPKERENILRGKPACIVASSGMLIGGASVWYAERLINDEKNAIFITGYQDEESPGRKLLNLADGAFHSLELNGAVHDVKCRVDKYGLSAHGDAGELSRFAETLDPTYTLLVHGDDDARFQLNETIDPRFHPLLVENGESYPFERRKTGKGITGKRYRAGDADSRLKGMIGCLVVYRDDASKTDWKIALCTGIHPRIRTIICQTPKGKQVKLTAGQVAETVGKWNRSIDELEQACDEVFSFSRPFLSRVNWQAVEEGTWTLDEVLHQAQAGAVGDLKSRLAVALGLLGLPDDQRYFDADGKMRYRMEKDVIKKLAGLQFPVQGMKMNATKAMEKVRLMMAGSSHFIRLGGDSLGTGNEHLTLYFDFPDTVTEKERHGLLNRIKEETGWTAAISDSVRTDLLQAKLMDLLGSFGSPSIYVDERRVTVPVQKPEAAEKFIASIKKDTGFALQFKEEETAAADRSPAAGRPEMYQTAVSSERLENNQAIEETKKWALERGITLYKAGIKQNNGLSFIEVHFVTPQIARRHAVDMEELSYRTGFPVTFAKNPKQDEVIRLTAALVPDSWGLRKNPSLHLDKAQVSLKLAVKPSEEERKQVAEKIEALTGYHLMI